MLCYEYLLLKENYENQGNNQIAKEKEPVFFNQRFKIRAAKGESEKQPACRHETCRNQSDPLPVKNAFWKSRQEA